MEEDRRKELALGIRQGGLIQPIVLRAFMEKMDDIKRRKESGDDVSVDLKKLSHKFMGQMERILKNYLSN